MAESTVRERILQALEDLPPDATFDDAIERLVFLAKIDAGLAELDAGKRVPHDEAKRQLGISGNHFNSGPTTDRSRRRPGARSRRG